LIPEHCATLGAGKLPFNLADVESKIRASTVTRETLVWNQSLVEWTKAGKVTELSAYFPVMPPPLPTGNTAKE
jgi:hypothetical protein